MEAAKKIFFGIFLTVNGASTWIMLETWHLAPPVCVVSPEAYEQAPPPVVPRAQLKRNN